MVARHILVPLDFSEPAKQALEYAIELATILQARLTLLHIVQTIPVAGGAGVGVGVALAGVMEQMEAEALQTMEDHAQRVRQAGLACETAVVHGTPFQHIIDMAGDKQVDLIVMGTHGHTGLQRFFLGSVAEKVVRLAPCPVLVTRAPDAPADA